MKLIFAHDHFFHKYEDKYYSTGGLSKEMLERYTSHFDEVTVISRQKELLSLDNKLTLASTDRTTFVKIPNFKSVKGLHQLIDAKKIIRKEIENSDYVIARLPSSIGEIAVQYAKFFNKPYLVEMVACPWDSLINYNFYGKIIAPFTYYKTKKIVKNSPYTVYVTNEFLQNRYPTNGRSVSCSNVSLAEMNNDIITNRINRINKYSNHKLIIGTVAAVDVKYKGQQFVIQALGELKKSGIVDFEYQLVGGGNQQYLKSLAENFGVIDQVKFLGTLPHHKVFEWLDNIDLYVQPSRQEGLPRALIEAMSRGLAAFGAKTAGIPELLDEKYVFSNTSNNITEICNILKNITPEEMLNQAIRNYGEAQKYEKHIIEERRHKFFEEFISQS